MDMASGDLTNTLISWVASGDHDTMKVASGDQYGSKCYCECAFYTDPSVHTDRLFGCICPKQPMYHMSSGAIPVPWPITSISGW